MPFELEEVKADEEFDQIWPVLFDAFEHPYNPFFKHFNPIHTTREDALEESKKRYTLWWKDDPNCHWLKVTDSDLKEVVGAACWQVHEHVPESALEPFEAYWHVEGSVEKQFAERFLDGLKHFIGKRMVRPYLELDQIVVDPKHRNRGIARELVRWGTDRADQLGVECVIVSTLFAREAYEKCGFTCAERMDIDMESRDASRKWKEYKSEDLHSYIMWRPAGHDFALDDSIPWQKNN